MRGVGDQARHDDQRRVPQHVAAAEPAGDLLRREPVAAQVGGPGLAHRVQQRRPGLGRLQDDETPRLAVMRSGRGQRGADRPAGRAGIDRLGGERADGPAGQRDIRRPEPEHVLVGGADEGSRARPVLLGDQVGQPAHDRDRDAERLALHQVARGRDLVGDGGHGDLEDVAEGVSLAAMVARREHARRADGVVGLPGPPRPAHGVGDDHAEPDAGQGLQRLAQPPGRLVGIGGQQHHGARRGVGLIDAGGGQDQAVPGLGDGRAAAPRDHPHGLGLDRLIPRGGDHPALGLADDLRGDHQDVAVAQAGRALGDERGQVRPWRDLRQPGDGGDRDRAGHRRGSWASSTARSTAARAIAAVAGMSRMYSGRARTSMSASAGSSAAALSWSSTSQPPIRSGP